MVDQRQLTVGVGRAETVARFFATRGVTALDGVFLIAAENSAAPELGAPILGRLAEAPAVLDQMDPARRAVVVVLDSLGDLRGQQGLLLRLAATGRQVVRSPAQDEWIDVVEAVRGKGRAVSLDLLLGRSEPGAVEIDDTLPDLRAAHVLVTGAGGSIGSEICLTLARLGCARLTMLDLSEHNLFSIDRRVAEAAPSLRRRALLCDIRDRKRVVSALTRERPTVVFHAAALKHVPMVEAHPSEGVLTNLVGTRNVVDACILANVQAMVFVSTDKAVQPTSVMGLTKRLAEDYVHARDQESATAGGSRLVSVRFGNVFGSSGSVAPIFAEQIERGGPVTLTHPDMERYFMTPQEAVQLTLRALSLGLADADRACGLYVLEMGDPVRITEFANRMIEAYGLIPGKDVAIAIVGARPGEKITEALVDADETGAPSDVAGVTKVKTSPLPLPRDVLSRLEAAARDHDDGLVVRILGEINERRASAVA